MGRLTVATPTKVSRIPHRLTVILDGSAFNVRAVRIIDAVMTKMPELRNTAMTSFLFESRSVRGCSLSSDSCMYNGLRITSRTMFLLSRVMGLE